MLRLKKFGRLPLYAFLIFCCLSTVVFSDDAGAEVEPEINGTSIRAPFSEEDQDQLKKAGETHRYQAEVNRLMDIIINSLYTQKEVFLRELISNAADALEKARFASVTDKSILDLNPEFEIRIEADKEAKTLTIMDTGIGMGKKELVNNLGTVARSGTTNFLEALSSGADLNLIGQFGVGFYSAFLVSDKVTVISKSPSDPVQHVWVSSADASFTVAPDPRGNTISRGTQIILHLKDDATQFLEDRALRQIILKFNQYVNFPIYLWAMKEVLEKVPIDDPRPEEYDPYKEKPKEGERQPVTKMVKKKVLEWEHVNQLKPIWLRPKEDVNETEYHNFCMQGLREYYEPIAYSHFSAEGDMEFKSILYIPRYPMQDDWSQFYNQKQSTIKLYSRRILIAEESYELMPKWLSFVKGVVDSDDLPLKVDRESLSQTKMMQAISKKLVGKTLELIRKLSREDKDAWKKYHEEIEVGDSPTEPETRFQKFWGSFGKNLKMGCVDDEEYRDKIANVIRWRTSKTTGNETVTLEDYVNRMPDEQPEILFYAFADYDAAMVSPHLKMYRKLDWEVIIMHDPLDESCIQKIKKFRTKPVGTIEITDAEIGLTKDEKKHYKRLVKAYKPLVDVLDRELGSKIGHAQVSQKLFDDPCLLTTDPYADGHYYERLIKSQAFSSYHGAVHNQYRVLEVNPNHPLIKKMLEMAIADPYTSTLTSLALTLMETAMLGSSFTVVNPTHLTGKLVKGLLLQAGIPENTPVEEFVVEIPDEEPTKEEKEDSTTMDEL